MNSLTNMLKTLLLGAIGEPESTNQLISILENASTIYVSPEQTGLGVIQSVSHNLGVVPSYMLVSVTDNTGAPSGKFTILDGSMSASVVLVTVTSGVKFKVLVST